MSWACILDFNASVQNREESPGEAGKGEVGGHNWREIDTRLYESVSCSRLQLLMQNIIVPIEMFTPQTLVVQLFL